MTRPLLFLRRGGLTYRAERCRRGDGRFGNPSDESAADHRARFGAGFRIGLALDRVVVLVEA